MGEDFYSNCNAAQCSSLKQQTEEKMFETLYTRLTERVSELDYYSNEILSSVSKLKIFTPSPRKEVDQKGEDVVGNFSIKIDELSVVVGKLIQISNVLDSLV